MTGAALTTLVAEVLSRQDAQRMVTARNAAVRCCAQDWLDEAFGPRVLILPRLPQSPTDDERDRYRIACDLARASSAHDNASRLRGAFWAEVTLRLALSRNRGDEESQRALRILRGVLNDDWPAPSVTAQQLEYFAVPPFVWQSWAAEAEVPATVPHRDAVARLHVKQALAAPTSLHSRGRQADIFDPPRRAHG